MDSRYFTLIRDLTEAAAAAAIMAKNVNYDNSLDRPDEDDLNRLITQANDILKFIERNIRNQVKR